MIRFSNVTKLFGLKKALDQISLQIHPGELVAVTGPSGAGKTTLLQLLAGALLPNLGEIFVDDIRIHDLLPDELQRYRRNLGIIFQDYRLLPQKTVHENVALATHGQPVHVVEYVPELLRLLGIHHRAHAFPHELSGGEMQRAAIARALVHRPNLILADEPTGNLDSENEKNIMDLLKQIHREGRTIVLTTHNIPLANSIGCRVIHLRDGKIVD